LRWLALFWQATEQWELDARGGLVFCLTQPLLLVELPFAFCPFFPPPVFRNAVTWYFYFVFYRYEINPHFVEVACTFHHAVLPQPNPRMSPPTSNPKTSLPISSAPHDPQTSHWKGFESEAPWRTVRRWPSLQSQIGVPFAASRTHVFLKSSFVFSPLLVRKTSRPFLASPPLPKITWHNQKRRVLGEDRFLAGGCDNLHVLGGQQRS